MEPLRRVSLLATFLTLAALPFGIMAVVDLPMGSAGVHEWLPDGREEREDYDRFVRAFGHDHILLVSWDGCTQQDPRLAHFRQQLETAELQRGPPHQRRLASVRSSDQLLSQLTQPPLRLSQELAKERLEGFLVGADGTAVLLITATEKGGREQAATIESIYEAADQVPSLGRSSLRIAGSLFEGYAVDQAAAKSLVMLVPFSSCLGLGVAWFCLGRLRWAIAALLIAGIGQLFSVALVYYSGKEFSAVLIVLPTLVFMLTLSGAVHLVNYYRDSLKAGVKDPGMHALQVGWRPCVLSSVTTIFGMGSLLTSQLEPVREFGWFSALALFVATAVLLLAFPTTMRWVDGERQASEPTASAKSDALGSALSSRTDHASRRAPLGQAGKNRLELYGVFLDRWAVSLSFASLVFLAVCSFGLFSLKASTKFTDMFPLHSRVNQDMHWIEEHIGPIATVEVLVHFPSESEFPTFDRLRWVRNLSSALRQSPAVGGVMSAVSLVPAWTEQGSVAATARRSGVRRGITESSTSLYDAGMVADTENGQAWRIIAKVSATSAQDYGQIIEEIQATCQRVLDQGLSESDSEEPTTQGIEIAFTGLTPIMHQTQITLLKDLGYSFLTAFLLITPILMWVTRSWRGGLLAMIPNVFPVAAVFGTMGWFNLRLDIAGILTASVAMGIAVDDTLHYLCWYMARLPQVASRSMAVVDTFRSCGLAMIHTTLISCLSMAPFLLADFLPTQQFAKLMISLLFLAIVGDLFILPALLLSPWGAIIGQRPESHQGAT